VTNVAPRAGVSENAPAHPSDRARSLTLTATDAAADQRGSFTWSVAWGDGRSDSVTGTTPRTGSHTYAEPGTYRVTVTVRDDDGATSAAVTRTITVAAPPIVTPPSPPGPSARLRLEVPRLSVFGRHGSRARCRVRSGRISACTIRVRVGRRTVARGTAKGTPRRRLAVALRLTPFGHALLERRLGGVRARVRARARTSGRARIAVAGSRAILRVEQFRTAAGSWMPDRATLTARGRRFVRGLRGKLIAVASLRCVGHDANLRGSAAGASRLSRARAATMCRALRTLGVRPRPRLAGHGSADPIASNATRSGRAKNRRVEVTITHRLRRP
jgi:hypothetical protein